MRTIEEIKSFVKEQIQYYMDRAVETEQLIIDGKCKPFTEEDLEKAVSGSCSRAAAYGEMLRFLNNEGEYYVQH